MEGQVDSHEWVSKMETQCRLSGKPDIELEVEPDTRTADEEPIEAHLLQGGQAGRIGSFLKSQAVSVQRVLSRKADSKHGRSSAEPIAAHRFASQLLHDLSRFKA